MGFTTPCKSHTDRPLILYLLHIGNHFHDLRVLKRGGIPSCELILIYYALVRSILEYCCIVWHDSLPVYLTDIIERVQKRTLKVILPGMSYYEALTELHCPRVDERRGALCEKWW